MVMSGAPMSPGEQVAQFALVLAKNEGVSRALYYLTDAMVRIANGTPDPRLIASLAIELINTAIPPADAPPAAPMPADPSSSGEPPAT